jgi:hypothetical protein
VLVHRARKGDLELLEESNVLAPVGYLVTLEAKGILCKVQLPQHESISSIKNPI